MLYIVDECLKIYNNKFMIWFNKLNEVVGVYVIDGVYVVLKYMELYLSFVM